MNGFEMLEKMEMISPEYVEEADEEFRAAKKSRGKLLFFSYAGMAAGFVLMVVSVGMMILNAQPAGGPAAAANGWMATAISENGNLPLILLIISVALIAFFAVLLIRRKKSDG